MNLRHRIEIQQRIVNLDEHGIASETWVLFLSVWASIEPLRGREYFQSKTENAEITAKIKMRYTPGITPAMRAVYKGRVFSITSVIDINERHREIHLMCQEAVNG